MNREQCLGIVQTSYARVAEEAGLAADGAAETTPLVGPGSVLDSMALVSLVLDVEQRLDEELGVAVSLMDERALSRRHSPFRTIATLVDYVLELETGDGTA